MCVLRGGASWSARVSERVFISRSPDTGRMRLFCHFRRATVALAAVAAAEQAAPTVSSDVIQLSDATFEHLTQASTGATTGDWFVKFFAPWCGHCKRLAPDWEQLATEAKGIFNVAEVDCTNNKATCERFEIRGYPTLLHFHDGKFYRHQGARSVEGLKAFATEGYRTANGTNVPRASLTLVEKVVRVIRAIPAETQKAFRASHIGFVAAVFAGAVLGATLKGFQRRCCGGGRAKMAAEGGKKKQ